MDSFNPSGYGMSLEVGYAKGKNKPILYIDNMTTDYRNKYFGMVRSVSTVVHSVKEARDIIIGGFNSGV